MKTFDGYTRGMGIGGWLTNYKTPNDGNRFSLVDDDTRAILSQRLLRIIQGLE